MKNANLTGRLRLFSGLVLFFFVTTHLLNHGLGLLSYEVLERGREIFAALWRSIPGNVLLAGALLTHLVLGLRKVLLLPSLRMPVWEFLQVGLGLAIPLLLVPHVIGVRISTEVLGFKINYALELMVLWG